ncbi:MAG: GtrA family protein [Crocinitomicaceae bacterium]
MNLSELPDYQKQFIKFVLIGMLAVLVDLACYYFFLSIFPEKFGTFFTNEMISKSCSFVCGSFVTYNLNKYWTWKQTNKSHKRFVKFFSLYLISLLINVSVNSGMLYLLLNVSSFEVIPAKYLVAFVMATGISALFNFFGQKWWIFKSEPISQ